MYIMPDSASNYHQSLERQSNCGLFVVEETFLIK